MNSILYLFYQIVGNARLAEMMFNFQDSNNYQEQHFLNWLRNKCNGRMDYFDIAIKLCGPPITRHRRFLLAKIYSWHSVGYSDKAIYYINLYLKNGLYKPMIKSNGIYTNKQMKKIHLWEMNRYLGKAYENLKDYENALKYYQVSLNYRPNIQLAYLDIANIYKKKKKLDKAISILDDAKKSKYASKHKDKFILGDDYIDIDVIDRVLTEYKEEYFIKTTYPYKQKEVLELIQEKINLDKIDYKITQPKLSKMLKENNLINKNYCYISNDKVLKYSKNIIDEVYKIIVENNCKK